MTSITLSDLRNSTEFFKSKEIATIVNGRKKEELGFFVPKAFEKEFYKFLEDIEKKRKRELLERVAKASKKDVIGDGVVGDGIK